MRSFHQSQVRHLSDIDSLFSYCRADSITPDTFTKLSLLQNFCNTSEYLRHKDITQQMYAKTGRSRVKFQWEFLWL